MKCEMRKYSACSKHNVTMQTTAEFVNNWTADICLKSQRQGFEKLSSNNFW